MRKRDVKVGTKVRIVDKPRNFENDCGFIPDMKFFVGKEAVVTRITNSGFFKLDVDGDRWSWDARWLKKVE
jgi:hypothetical protein